MSYTMYLTVIFVCLALCAPGKAVDFPEAPANLQVDAKGSNAVLTWDVVVNATGYEVTLSSGQRAIARIPTASFSGLAPMQTYTALVVAVSGNETGDAAEISFTTSLGKVMGFGATGATENTISVEWMTNALADSYTISVFNDEDEKIENATIAQVNGTAVIGDLQPVTFYKIYINSVASFEEGEKTMIRARTDGSGFKMTGLWENGGSGMVFRPLNPPLGVLYIGVQFPCVNMDYIHVWNADQDFGYSRPARGYYVLRQDEEWMRQKSEIGMTYFENSDTICNYENQSVVVTFGDDVELVLAENITRIGTDIETVVDVEFDQNQWDNSSDRTLNAGLLRLRLDKTYHGVDGQEPSNTTSEKPAYGTFVIVLNPGEDCDKEGLFIGNVWGMTLKDTTGLSDDGNRFYFTQLGSDWYTLRPGFLYGYDPDICPDQFNMTVSVMINGSSVTNIFSLPNL